VAYRAIDEWHERTTEMEQLALDLADQEDMFELTVVQYREITDTRKVCSFFCACFLMALVKIVMMMLVVMHRDDDVGGGGGAW